MRKTKTFTKEYNFFTVGTKVRPISSRSVLPEGVYTVTEMYEPAYDSDEAVCFVKGYQLGVSTEYLTEVEE